MPAHQRRWNDEQVNLIAGYLPGVGGPHNCLSPGSGTNGNPHGYTYPSAAHRYPSPHSNADAHAHSKSDSRSYKHAPANCHTDAAHPKSDPRPYEHAPANRHTGAAHLHSKPSAAYSHTHSRTADSNTYYYHWDIMHPWQSLPTPTNPLSPLYRCGFISEWLLERFLVLPQ